MKPDQQAIAMSQTNLAHAAELERQQLIKQCHCLIAVIANRPGGTKLLRGILPTLQMYAQYKANRKRQGSVR